MQVGDFCIKTLWDALASGVFPEIFITDKGSQFTSPNNKKVLLEGGTQSSMDGRG
jgi:hypothetical protein